MQKNTFSLNVLEEIDEEILSRLEHMNIDRRQARKYIIANQHNTVTTTYYLLLKQKLMTGGKIVTGEILGNPYQVATEGQPEVSTGPVSQPVQKNVLRLTSQGERVSTKPPTAYSPKSSITHNESVTNQRPSDTSKRQVSREVSPNTNKQPQAKVEPIVITSKKRTDQTIEAPQVPSEYYRVEGQRQEKEGVKQKEIYNSAPPTMEKLEELAKQSRKSSNQPKVVDTRENKSDLIMTVKVEAEVVFRNSFIEFAQVDSSPEGKTSNRSSMYPSDSQRKLNDTDREQNLLRVTSAGSTIKSLATTMNKYSKTGKPSAVSAVQGKFATTFNTDRKNSHEANDNERSLDSHRAQLKMDQQPRKLSTPKVNNIYKNLKRFTSISSKIDGNHSFSKKTKGTTKSSSQSREKKSFMRTIDIGRDRSAARTTRKVSNPSFQTASTEDKEKPRPLIAFKPTNQDQSEPKKIRNPFSLDMISESNPIDLVRELQAMLKKQKLITTTKVR